MSNELATIYFRFPTSTASAATSSIFQSAQLSFLSSTQAVLNDGLGTFAVLTTSGATYTPQALKGQYVPVDALQNAIANDTTPPEPFTIGSITTRRFSAGSGLRYFRPWINRQA